MLNGITGSPAAAFVYVSHNIHIIGKNHIKHCNIMLDGKGVPSTPPPRYEFASTCMLPLLKYIYMCRPKYLYTKSLTCFYIYFVRKLFDMALGDKGPATSKELRLIVTPNLSRQVQEKFGVVVPMSYLVSM